MNIAHLLNPYYMMYAIFSDNKADFNYELDNEKTESDLRKFNELMEFLVEIADNEEVDINDTWLNVELSKGGVDITTNFREDKDGDEDEDEDEEDEEEAGNLYFHFDHFGNFLSLETEYA